MEIIKIFLILLLLWYLFLKYHIGNCTKKDKLNPIKFLFILFILTVIYKMKF